MRQTVKRFTGRDYQLFVGSDYDWLEIIAWKDVWELGISNYYDSYISFEKLVGLTTKEYKMARQAATDKKGNQTNWKGFINVPLTEDDKEKISAAWQKAKYGDVISELVEAGKLTVSFNAKNQSFNASVVFYHDALAGWCVSSFAPNAMQALFVTYFKLVAYGDTLSPDMAQPTKSDFG